MATRDLRSYFTGVSKDKKASHGSCTSIPRLVKATGNVTAADASAVNAELESFSKKNERQGSPYNTNIPSRIKEEVGKYAHTYGTQAAIKRFKSKYPHYTFLRTTIIGNVSSIKNKVCHPNHRHSGKLGVLILSEMNWCKK